MGFHAFQSSLSSSLPEYTPKIFIVLFKIRTFTYIQQLIINMNEI